MRALAAALLAMVVIGCGSFSAPAPSPGTMDDVIAALVLRGVTVHRLVGGDAGCPSSDLHSNAVHMQVALGSQSATHEIYLFRWRRAVDFDSSGQAFADCIAEFESLNPARPVDRLEARPWRAYGPGWTEQLRATLDAALLAVGGG